MHEAKPLTPPLALTVRNACALSGIGRTLLYKLIDTGQLRRVKVGKRTLIPFDDLQKLVAPREANGEAA
jgi:excisionase family DNA binding protein